MSFSIFRSASVAILLAICSVATACTSAGDESAPTTTRVEGGGATASTTSAVPGAPTSTTTPRTTAGADTSWTVQTGGADAESAGLGSSDAPAMMLVQFAQAWEDGNWKAMASIAEGTVVSTATEWYTKGGETSADVDDLVDDCRVQVEDEDDAWVCEFRYGSPDSAATAFTLTFGRTDQGIRITDLVATG